MLFGFQKRYLLAILVFFGIFNMFYLRTNLSIAIVEMTSSKEFRTSNGTIVKQDAEFSWSPGEKAFILSAFSYGYITNIIAGVIVTRFGGATTFGFGIALTAIFTLLTPFFIQLHTYVFVSCRVLEGIFEALSYCSVSEIWSRWSPPSERSKLVALSFTGGYVGLTFSFPISGFLANLWGWRSVFYVSGIISLIWSVIWFSIAHDDPSVDKWISREEQLFLKNELNRSTNKKIRYPWKSIFTSIPVWSLSLTEFVFSCGFTFFMLFLPQYIKDIFDVNIHEIGFMSAVPHLGSAISHPIAGFLADHFRNAGIMSATQVHKLYISLGCVLGACLYIGTIYAPNMLTTMICLLLFRVITSFSDVAFHVNVIDMSYQYASVLFGINVFFFTIAAIVCPNIVGYIVTNHRKSQWNTCFLIFSGVYLFGALIYFLFGSGELQPWANFHDNDWKTMQKDNLSMKHFSHLPDSIAAEPSTKDMQPFQKVENCVQIMTTL